MQNTMPYLENFPVPFIEIEETDSTNRYLSEYCRNHKVDEFTTVSTTKQTAGKGQMGNRWESEPGKNLTCSFVVYPTFIEAKNQFIISQIVSLSIKEELEQWIEHISIKWPNDIYWKEKKICGILIENDLTGSSISKCIVGFGLNINQQEFRSDAPNPVSLYQITGKEHDQLLILSGIMQRLKAYYMRLQHETINIESSEKDYITKKYEKSLFRKEGFHRYTDQGGEFLAHLVRVEPDGRLILEDTSGRTRLYLFKEVHYIL